MPTKPTNTIDWDGTNGGADPGNVSEPISGRKTTGWLEGDRPPAEEFNWFWRLITDWIKYINNMVGTAPNGAALTGTGAGTGAGFDGTGGGSSGPGLKGTGGTSNGRGVQGQGTGTGSGIHGTGGGSNGDGVTGVGGATNGVGVRGTGTGTGKGGIFTNGVTVDTIDVTGNETVGGTLGVTGTTSLNGNATVGGTLGVTGLATFTAGCDLTGDRAQNMASPSTGTDGANRTFVENTVSAAVSALLERSSLDFGAASSSSGSSTEYLWPGGVLTSAAPASEHKKRMPFACTISKLYISAETAPTGGSATFTVRKNGVDTAITATLGSGSTSASDLTHSEAFAAGDDISIKVVGNAIAVSGPTFLMAACQIEAA